MSKFRVSFTVPEISDAPRVLVINPAKNEELKPMVRAQIKIDKEFDIWETTWNAIITHSEQVFEGDILVVKLREEENPPADVIVAQESQQVVKKAESIEIDISENFKDPIQGKRLLDMVNCWAVLQKFKCKISEGEKKGKNGVTRTFKCLEKECDFQLKFYAEYVGAKDKDDTDELFYCIKSSSLIHNHELNYTQKDEFNEQIISRIDKVKGKTKTLKDLQDLINEEFKTKFEYYQIIYQVNKLFEENFGRPDEDANSFLNAITEEIEKNGGYYEKQLDSDNCLQKVLFVSKQMLDYSDKFLDIVFVDSTYRRNRFNMPLFNVCGRNNYGKTIMLAFALLNNETKESYDWVFSCLRRCWKSNPIYFISDESQEIIHGFLIFDFL